MMPGEHQVLVTGGSGYVAGQLILRLLTAGYRVRTTLRSREQEAALRAMVADHGVDPERLLVAVADLTSDAGWVEALAGCTYVQHVASPLSRNARNGDDLVSVARDGTLRVLRAAAANRIGHVVLTSSLIAARPPERPGDTRFTTDETIWTDPDEPGREEYARSKTLAERAAWDFIRDDASGMTLTTILPGMIVGPAQAQDIHGSVAFVASLLSGRMARLPRIGFAVSDVRDLVDIHMRAMTDPAAVNQRFLAAGDFLWLHEMAQILRNQLGDLASRTTSTLFPDAELLAAAQAGDPAARAFSINLGKRLEVDTRKARERLGWQPRPSPDALLDCARSIIAQGAL